MWQRRQGRRPAEPLRGDIWKVFLRTGSNLVPGLYQELTELNGLTRERSSSAATATSEAALNRAPTRGHLALPADAVRCRLLSYRDTCARASLLTRLLAWALDSVRAAAQTCREQIAKDVPRTFPTLPAMDALKEAELERVLLAHASYRPETGYCQARGQAPSWRPTGAAAADGAPARTALHTRPRDPTAAATPFFCPQRPDLRRAAVRFWMRGAEPPPPAAARSPAARTQCWRSLNSRSLFPGHELLRGPAAAARGRGGRVLGPGAHRRGHSAGLL